MTPTIFYSPPRTEYSEVFSIQHLNVYLDQLKKQLEKQKLESQLELQCDNLPASPILIIDEQTNSIAIYQHALQNITKLATKGSQLPKYSVFVYLNSLSPDYWRELFNLYQIQIYIPEAMFYVTIRSVITQQNVDELQQKFFFAKTFNLYTYRSGLHKALLKQHAFDSSLYLLFSDQYELIKATQFSFDIKNKILQDLNDPKKQRTPLQDCKVEGSQVILKGQVIRMHASSKPYAGQKRLVVAVLDTKEPDFIKSLHHYTVLTKKHRTTFFATVFKEQKDVALLKKNYEDAVSLNIGEDTDGKLGERLLANSGLLG